MKLKIWIITFAVFILNPLTALAVEIGVYISVDQKLVTAAKTQQQWQAVIDAMLFEANELYDESHVDIQLTSSQVDFRMMSFTKSSLLLKKIAGGYGEFKNILTEADRYGADYIIVLTALNKFNLCGQAIDVNRTQASISKTSMAIALSDPDCGEDTLVHELGHLMGLAHGNQVSTARNSNHRQALTRYAKGWGKIVALKSASSNEYSYIDEAFEAGEYGTIMVGNHIVYWTGSTWNVKVPLFSSPDNFDDRCGAGGCGDAANGDARRALNENRFTYASHEERDADRLSYTDLKLTNCLVDSYGNTEVSDLRKLSCSSKGISNIAGVEQLSSLETIDFSYNKIVNLESLDKFSESNIQLINLYGNDTALCHQLESLDSQFPGRVIMPDRCFNIGAFVAILSIL